MATFNKFYSFVEDLAEGKHDFSTDQIRYALQAAAPSQTDSVLTDLDAFTYTNLTDDGPGSRGITTAASAQTTGTYKLTLTDITITASGGAINTFRYIVLYNDGAPSDELIGWYDYGADLDLANTETLLIDFDGTNGVLTIA